MYSPNTFELNKDLSQAQIDCESAKDPILKEYSCLLIEVTRLTIFEVNKLEGIVKRILYLQKLVMIKKNNAIKSQNKNTALVKSILNSKNILIKQQNLWVQFPYVVQSEVFYEDEIYDDFHRSYIVTYSKYRRVVYEYRRSILVRPLWYRIRYFSHAYFGWSMSVYWPYYYRSYWIGTDGISYTWHWFNSYVFHPFTSLYTYTSWREPGKFDVEAFEKIQQKEKEEKESDS